MSAADKCNFHPAERLFVSSQAYTEKHVKNIAARLCERNSASLPNGFNYWNQDKYASWIAQNFSRDEIETAERLVRQSYSYGEKIYRKGRPIGSKNKNPYLEVPSQYHGAASWEAELGLSEAPATPLASIPEPPASEPSTGPVLHPDKYVLKTELEGHINRIGRDVNDHMHKHNSEIKSYCAREFSLIDLKFNGVAKLIENIKINSPTIVTLERKELPPIELGVQHRHFPELLAMCNASLRSGSRINVWIYGPAGTGKTTAAHNVANALSLPFYAMSALETGFQIIGYNDANGNYVSTLFRQCWEHGGIIILDEIDSYQPSAALALNGALANGHCAFPDKIVSRHKDCIIIAGANTTGLGGTMEYSGRMKQDAAFLDRWCPLDWPLDEALEDSLCANKEWLTIVRKVRANVIRVQMKGCMVTPRASIYGEALLAAGLSLDRVIKSVLYKGMSQAQIEQVKP